MRDPPREDAALVGRDFDQAEFETHPLLRAQPPILLTAFRNYRHEHLMPQGSDLRRLTIIARNICGYFGFDRDPQTLKRADLRAYREHRLAQGVKNPTVRREYAFLSAAIRHEHREERLLIIPKIEMPPQGDPRKRFLTEEEVVRVMRVPMKYRIRMFFRLAFATAARATAIEQLTWDRVDWVNGLIDYNVPGARRTKKRRAVVPIANDLRPFLEAAYQRHLAQFPDDPYVIGRGCCSYQQCKDVMKAAGIDEEGVARHVARKTFASQALLNGVDLAKVAGVLADRQTTVEKHYGFILPQHLVDAVNYKRAAL
jgi:integrase